MQIVLSFESGQVKALSIFYVKQKKENFYLTISARKGHFKLFLPLLCQRLQLCDDWERASFQSESPMINKKSNRPFLTGFATRGLKTQEILLRHLAVISW